MLCSAQILLCSVADSGFPVYRTSILVPTYRKSKDIYCHVARYSRMNSRLPHAATPVLSVQDAVFPAHPFSGVLAIGREQNWRLQEMFPALSLSPDGCPDNSRRINYLQAREGLLQARQQGGADIAILSGARKSLPQLGCMATGMLAQESLQQALAFGLEYQLIAGSMVQLELESGAQHSALVAHSLFQDQELQDFLDTDHLATAINAARQLCGQQLQLVRVELRGRYTFSRSACDDFFGCTVVDGADVSRVVFANTMLATRLRAPDALAVLASRQACEEELASVGVLGRQSLLRKLVAMQCEFRNVQDMAAALGISPRSLHRLLAREGTSYFHVTESVRIERAKRLLQAGLSQEQIAEELGYSDSRSFRRAFKRWTLQTPTAYRAHAAQANQAEV